MVIAVGVFVVVLLQCAKTKIGMCVGMHRLLQVGEQT